MLPNSNSIDDLIQKEIPENRKYFTTKRGKLQKTIETMESNMQDKESKSQKKAEIVQKDLLNAQRKKEVEKKRLEEIKLKREQTEEQKDEQILEKKRIQDLLCREGQISEELNGLSKIRIAVTNEARSYQEQAVQKEILRLKRILRNTKKERTLIQNRTLAKEKESSTKNAKSPKRSLKNKHYLDVQTVFSIYAKEPGRIKGEKDKVGAFTRFLFKHGTLVADKDSTDYISIEYRFGIFVNIYISKKLVTNRDVLNPREIPMIYPESQFNASLGSDKGLGFLPQSTSLRQDKTNATYIKNEQHPLQAIKEVAIPHINSEYTIEDYNSRSEQPSYDSVTDTGKNINDEDFYISDCDIEDDVSIRGFELNQNKPCEILRQNYHCNPPLSQYTVPNVSFESSDDEEEEEDNWQDVNFLSPSLKNLLLNDNKAQFAAYTTQNQDALPPYKSESESESEYESGSESDYDSEYDSEYEDGAVFSDKLLETVGRDFIHDRIDYEENSITHKNPLLNKRVEQPIVEAIKRCVARNKHGNECINYTTIPLNSITIYTPNDIQVENFYASTLKKVELNTRASNEADSQNQTLHPRNSESLNQQSSTNIGNDNDQNEQRKTPTTSSKDHILSKVYGQKLREVTKSSQTNNTNSQASKSARYSKAEPSTPLTGTKGDVLPKIYGRTPSSVKENRTNNQSTSSEASKHHGDSSQYSSHSLVHNSKLSILDECENNVLKSLEELPRLRTISGFAQYLTVKPKEATFSKNNTSTKNAFASSLPTIARSAPHPLATRKITGNDMHNFVPYSSKIKKTPPARNFIEENKKLTKRTKEKTPKTIAPIKVYPHISYSKKPNNNLKQTHAKKMELSLNSIDVSCIDSARQDSPKSLSSSRIKFRSSTPIGDAKTALVHERDFLSTSPNSVNKPSSKTNLTRQSKTAPCSTRGKKNRVHKKIVPFR